jgi:hypothetical protein
MLQRYDIFFNPPNIFPLFSENCKKTSKLFGELKNNSVPLLPKVEQSVVQFYMFFDIKK